MGVLRAAPLGVALGSLLECIEQLLPRWAAAVGRLQAWQGTQGQALAAQEEGANLAADRDEVRLLLRALLLP